MRDIWLCYANLWFQRAGWFPNRKSSSGCLHWRQSLGPWTTKEIPEIFFSIYSPDQKWFAGRPFQPMAIGKGKFL